MSIENDFHQAVEEWREHCRKNSFSSFHETYLDCDAYREIISMGAKVLPLIRKELGEGYETTMRYEAEGARLEVRVLGTASPNLSGERYRKISKDKAYQEYEERRGNDRFGQHEIYWRDAIREIVPDFDLPFEELGSDDEIQKATIDWLDENMGRCVLPQ